MKRVMIDLETFGTRPGSVILTIGAVVFSDMLLHEHYYARIAPRSCTEAGMTLDVDTVLWWLKQSDEARGELYRPNEGLAEVLFEFSQFLRDLDDDVELWGNGSDFDNVLLAEAYKMTGIQLPWKYNMNRCYRTIKNLYPEIKMNRIGVHHNALDDARAQAMHLMLILENNKTQAAGI